MATDTRTTPAVIRSILAWADQPRSAATGSWQALHTFVRVLLITAREFRKNELSLRAGALTYTILLSLVPLLAMSTSLVKGLGGGNHLRQVVYEYISTLEQNSPGSPGPETGATMAADNPDAPAATLTTHLRSAADKLFNYVDKTDFTTLGTIGVLLMFVTIIMVFDTIEKAMNTIWQVQSGRSTLRKLTDYLTLLILMPVAINTGFAASTVIKNPALLNRIASFLPMLWLQPLLLLLLPVLCITLALAVCYMVFPNTRVHAGPAFIGAILAGSLWFITQNIFISLQIGVSNYNAIYGSFATLPLFLLWLYLGWIFILTGSQVAFACQSHRHYLLLPQTASPAKQLSAALDISRQVFLCFDQRQPLTRKMLPDRCPEHAPSLLTATLDQLIAAGIIHCKDRQQRLFPSIPEDQLEPGLIVRTILGVDTPDTSGGRQSRQIIEAASHLLPAAVEKNQKR